jgi:hypothetical protein
LGPYLYIFMQFTEEDAGYRITDEALTHVLKHEPTCKWVSITTDDNAYGSEVRITCKIKWRTLMFGNVLPPPYYFSYSLFYFLRTYLLLHV